jgi:hypothetical protein
VVAADWDWDCDCEVANTLGLLLELTAETMVESSTARKQVLSHFGLRHHG